MIGREGIRRRATDEVALGGAEPSVEEGGAEEAIHERQRQNDAGLEAASVPGLLRFAGGPGWPT